MVCSLHSVTTGSRDRANVSLIIIYIIISRLSIFQRLERGQRGEGKANMKLDWRLITVKKADKDALHRNHEGISARPLKARVSIKSC